MRKQLGTVLAVAGLIAAPAIAQAQAHAGMAMGSPEHEFGADLVVGFQSFGSVGAVSGTSGLFVGTPVDLRVGFMSHSNMNFEMRTTLALSTAGSTTYAFDPGVNVLFKMGQGTMQDNKYFTVGADANITQIAPSTSGVVPAINAGVGMRSPYGSAAWRLEAFGRYVFKNTTVAPASQFQIGVRAGLSLWH